jgi:amino acid adenylation domain-containing protein
VTAWGLGEVGAAGRATAVLELPPGTGPDPDGWLAALAVTVCRYEGHDSTGVAILGTGTATVAVSLDDLRHPVPSTVDSMATVGLLLDERDPPYPLTISLRRPAHGRVVLRADHLLSHVAPPIAAQFLRHLAHVHRQLPAAPSTVVEDIALLDAAEVARVAALGRPTRPLVSTPRCLHDAFRRTAAATPDAIALTDGTTHLTYAELDRRSDRVAAGLRARGVRDRDRVGLCLERGAELVVSVLGVLKAGATYVPTDPAYPADRLAYTAADAGLRLVVTRMPDHPADATVTPDELAAAGTGHDPVTTGVTPDDPAYIIYTSGSTGRPKGVIVPHRCVVSLVDGTRDEYRLGPGDVWTLFHSIAFDVSVWEIWGSLLGGGRLVVVPHATTRDPNAFHQLLRRERVTVLGQTPSAFSQLLPVALAGDPLATRLVIFAGEPLDAGMLLPWFDRYPESVCRMVNMFGITETTVHSTETTVLRQHATAASRSVGTALPGEHLYVMDAAGRLVPPGVAGEIYVGGAGVSHGYLNRDDLTAARFLPDPHTGGRMYRSGDLGRLHPDGTLDHLGRIDNQVKIRGFRIELDEIRAVLLEHPDVQAAAVVARHDDPHDPATARLDAYVVTGSTDPAGIRKRVAAMLPDYMVPATVTALDALPLTGNGKLDRTRLPRPTVPTTRAGDAAPTADDDLAGHLRDVWGDLFDAAVGVDDDFFELGGNSLLAVRLNTALRTRNLPTVPLRELYRNPTIRGVVAVLRD